MPSALQVDSLLLSYQGSLDKLIKTFCLRRDLFSGLPRWLSGKESTCQYKRCEFDPWGWEDSLEKEMATHSSILAWEIPWTEEPGGLQSMGSSGVRHN